MKHFFQHVAIVFMLLWAGSAQAATFRIVIFGDSLTSGYRLHPEQSFPARLQSKLNQSGFDTEVINMSIPGDTTDGGAERVASVINKQPDIVMLELGANDALQGIDPLLVHRNLTRIIGPLVQHGFYIVFIGMKAPPNLGAAYEQQFAAVYQNLAKYYKLPFYPFVLEGIATNPQLNLEDGLHPNPSGVDVMVNNIYPLIDAGLRARWNSKNAQDQEELPKLSLPVAVDTPPPLGAH